MADIKVKKISLDTDIEKEGRDEFPHRTLRHAGLYDVPKIMEMAKEIFKGSPMEPLNISEDKVRQQLEKFIGSSQKDFLALVSHDEGEPVGVLAAYAFEPVFTRSRIACEVLWYLKPEYRKGRRGIDMMNAYEYWAKMVGCSVAQYGWLVSSPVKMPLLYEKSGAKLSEHVYYKDLSSVNIEGR